MADSALVLMKSVIAKLRADTTIAGLVGDDSASNVKIYSRVPQNMTFPYIQVEISSGDYSGHDFTGMEHTLSIKVWSRLESPSEAANIRAACYNVLNRNEAGLTLDSGTVAHIHYNGVGTIALDPDGFTWLALAQFRVVVT